jgi:hypothetical protein
MTAETTTSDIWHSATKERRRSGICFVAGIGPPLLTSSGMLIEPVRCRHLPAVKKTWKSVEKLRSGAFVGMWQARVAEFYSKYMATAAAGEAKQ